MAKIECPECKRSFDSGNMAFAATSAGAFAAGKDVGAHFGAGIVADSAGFALFAARALQALAGSGRAAAGPAKSGRHRASQFGRCPLCGKVITI